MQSVMRCYSIQMGFWLTLVASWALRKCLTIKGRAARPTHVSHVVVMSRRPVTAAMCDGLI
jgi:hypothetical protein